MRVGDVVVGRFELERLAGVGGMGSVYRATDLRTRRPAAVKVLARVDDTLYQRFVREAALLAGLDHPSIVRYLAHGTDRGEPFLAMEWLEGEDLAVRLARGPLEMHEAIALATHVAGALAHAHLAGIVHRDVKPANVLLVGGSVERAVLLDFGIARGPAGGSGTATGSAIGTPGYMSPEQARGERAIDARTDVFALGCVLYECLTGKAPFAGEHIVAILAKVLLDDAPHVSASVDVPKSLDLLVARMLAKSPADRLPDGRAVVVALEELDAGPAPTRAGPLALGLIERRVLSVALARADAFDMDPLGATMMELDAKHGRRDLTEAFQAFGATVERLADGSFLAVWLGDGAATDHAARAARCVLAVATALPTASLALATGRTVGTGGGMGDVIDRAARLVGAPRTDGQGNSPRVDEATAALLEARFELTQAPEGHRLVREREAEATVRTLLGKPTPFVGRERELELLSRALEDATSEPASRAMCVLAPAGTGKSRLAHEFVRVARDAGADVLVASADAVASGSSFAVAGKLVRAAAGLFENEPDRSSVQKLRGRVARSVAPAVATRVAEFLGEIAGAPRPDAEASAELRAARQDSRTMGDQMRRAWVEWISAEVALQPVVLVLEDLHWGDAPSVELINAALDELPDAPLLVVALARPEIEASLPRMFARSSVERIELRPLAKRASEQLVREVLGVKGGPEVSARLADRAAGNAFYLEELIRAVAEGSSDTLPDSVLAMLHARLAALDASARRVLRAASVFGERFWPDAVRALVGRGGMETVALALADLSSRELVQRRSRSSLAGEDEYAFRHGLVRDAAYELLTEDDRALAHRLAGGWLEARGGAEPIVLAEHFEKGEEPARAVPYYIGAARSALEGSDLAGAVDRAERGVKAGAVGADRAALRLVQAEARRWSGTSLLDAERDALEALSLLQRGTALWFTAVGEVAALRGALGDRERMAILGEALAALAKGEGAEAGDPFRVAVARMSAQLQIIGRFELGDQLLGALEASTPIERRTGVIAGWLGWTRLLRELMRGSPVVAAEYGRAGTAAFESVGAQRVAAMVQGFEGMAYIYMGAPSEALDLLGTASATLGRLGARNLVDMLRASVAEAWLDLGDLAAGAAAARDTATAAARIGDWIIEGRAREILSRALLAKDPPAAAAEASIAEGRLGRAPPFRALALASLADARRASGEQARALEATTEAIATIRELEPLTFIAGRVRLAHARALVAAGDAGTANAVIVEARTILDARAATLDDPKRRQGWLEGIEAHRAIRAWSS